jgi:ABC-2 type transport system permease protein
MNSSPALPEGPPVLRGELLKMAAFLRRDFLVNWSYRLAFFSDWANVIFQVALFYFVGRLVDPRKLPSFGGRRPTYIEFVAIGILFSSFLQIGLGRVVTAMRNEQLMGTLESLLMTPTAPTTLQLGSVAYDIVYVPIRMIIFIALVSLVLSAHFALAGFGPAALVLLAFIPLVWGLGMASAAAVLTFKRGTGVVGLGGILVSSVSTTYFPIGVLPGWAQIFARWNPVTIALDATRSALIGRAGWADVVPAFLRLAPMVVISLALGVMAFRLALRRERRRGTLALY